MGSVVDQQGGLGSMPYTSSCHGVWATTTPCAACQSRQRGLVSTSCSTVTLVHESHMPEEHRSCHQLSLDQLGRTRAVLVLLTATAAAAAPDAAAGGLTNVVCGRAWGSSATVQGQPQVYDVVSPKGLCQHVGLRLAI